MNKVYPKWGPCHCGAGYGFPRVVQQSRHIWRLWWKCLGTEPHYEYQVIQLGG